MHEDELHIDVALVRRVLRRAVPQWAELAIAPVPPSGTANALYRLGDDTVARLPRARSPDGVADKDLEWLPTFAPRLPFPIPLDAGCGRWNDAADAPQARDA